jgi:hypothetical protein
MRFVLALGLLITLCASANAATRHRTWHPGTHQHIVDPQGVNAPPFAAPAPHFAVPGWTDGETQRWLNNASSAWTQA